MQRRRLPALFLTMLILIAVLTPPAPSIAAGGDDSAPMVSAWRRVYQGWHGAGLARVTTYSGSYRHPSELYYRTPDGRSCWGTWCGAGQREVPGPSEYFDQPATFSYPVLCIAPGPAPVKGYYRILFSGWTETKVETSVDFSGGPPYRVTQTTRMVEHPPADLILPVGLPGLGDPKLVRTDFQMTTGSDLLVGWAPSTPGLGSLPDSCWIMSEGAQNRKILYEVAPVAAQPRAQLLTDADAWKPGVPQTIYVRVEHDAAVPICPVSVKLDLPGWLQVEDAQGAQIAANELPAYQFFSPAREGETVPVRTLSWKATLKPGRPFERWVTVMPAEVPEGARALGVMLRPVEMENGNEIFKSELQWLWRPTGESSGPGSAAASSSVIPAKRQPGDAAGGGGCIASDQPRIIIKAEPPVLRERDGFASRITATIVDLPGLPAAEGAPVSLSVTAPGLLSNVASFGSTTTATLESSDRSPVDLTVTAETIDGDMAFLVVPLGRYFLHGQVLLRPGDGSEQPVDRALIGAWETGNATPNQTYTDTLGEYRTAVRSAEPLTITAEAGGYVKGQLPGKTPEPNDEDTIEAPPLYLVSQDTLLLARRRLEAIYGLHGALGPADNLAGWAGLFPPPDTPDPTAPGAGIPAWLDRAQQTMFHPPHQEEAIRRLNLALELEQIADRNAKWAADDISAALWDDGLGLLTDLWAAANGTFEITGKMADYYSSLRGKGDPVTQSLDLAKVNLLEQKNSLHDRIYDVLRRLTGNLSRAPAGLSSAEKAQWLDEKTNTLVSLITGKAWEQRQAALALWQPDPAAQQETLKAVTSPLPQGVSLDIKEVLADWISREYLEMVSAELTDALKTASADPAGFREGGYEVARLNVRDKLAFVEWTREKVSTTPVEAAFREFFDGTVADYQNWGQLAIAAVTAGAAVPAMKQIDVGLGLVQTFFKGVRVAKAMDAFFETLAPTSDWSRAVRDGIRTAFTSYAE